MPHLLAALMRRCFAATASLSETLGEQIAPLHCVAASSGEDASAVAQLLMRHGAQVNMKDAADNSPLIYCCRRGEDAGLCRLLLQAGAHALDVNKEQVASIHLAAAKGNVAMIEDLAKARADVNGASQKGTLPPLHLAVQRHNPDAVAALLKAGAHANLPSPTGRRPIHFAAFRKYANVVKVLLDHGAAIDALDLSSFTALSYAAQEGCIDTTTLLLAYDADPNLGTKIEKWTPLHQAAREGHSVVVAVLASHTQTDVDARDEELRTPLHWAVFSEDVPSLMMLLEHGANSMYEDAAGRTPAVLAAVKDCPEMLTVLQQHTGQSANKPAHGSKMDDLSAYWITKSASLFCKECASEFSFNLRRHACKPCRRVLCGKCMPHRLPADHRFAKAKVCEPCYAKETGSGGGSHNEWMRMEGGQKSPQYLQAELGRIKETMAEFHADRGAGYQDAFTALAPIGRKRAKKAASSSANVRKNRYPDILAYDATRTKLSSKFHKGTNDYINANYIRAPWADKKPAGHIAAQGPLPDSIHLFWQLVWEQQSNIVVMVTSLVEGGRQKCAQYWPSLKEGGEANSSTYADFTVTTTAEQKFPTYVLRTFELKVSPSIAKDQTVRTIHQYAFLKWPDHGVPGSVYDLLDFHSAVAAKRNECGSGPAVVHCSAGVGRTGTFIILDFLKQMVASGVGPLDIIALARNMRMCRNYMVQSLEQFVFVHKLCRAVIETELGIKRPPAAKRQPKNMGAAGPAGPTTRLRAMQLPPGKGKGKGKKAKRRGPSSAEAFGGELNASGDSFDLNYVGSQAVKTSSLDQQAVSNAITEADRRRATERVVTVAVSARGAEIIEKGQPSGALFAWDTICFYMGEVINGKPVFSFVVNKSIGRGICHCFDSKNERFIYHVAETFATVQLAQLTRNTLKGLSDEEKTDAQMRATLLLSRRETRGDVQVGSGDDELELALALSKSLAEQSGQAGAGSAQVKHAPNNPFTGTPDPSAVWRAAGTQQGPGPVDSSPSSNPFFDPELVKKQNSARASAVWRAAAKEQGELDGISVTSSVSASSVANTPSATNPFLNMEKVAAAAAAAQSNPFLNPALHAAAMAAAADATSEGGSSTAAVAQVGEAQADGPANNSATNPFLDTPATPSTDAADTADFTGVGGSSGDGQADVDNDLGHAAVDVEAGEMSDTAGEVNYLDDEPNDVNLNLLDTSLFMRNGSVDFGSEEQFRDKLDRGTAVPANDASAETDGSANQQPAPPPPDVVPTPEAAPVQVNPADLAAASQTEQLGRKAPNHPTPTQDPADAAHSVDLLAEVAKPTREQKAAPITIKSSAEDVATFLVANEFPPELFEGTAGDELLKLHLPDLKDRIGDDDIAEELDECLQPFRPSSLHHKEEMQEQTELSKVPGTLESVGLPGPSEEGGGAGAAVAAVADDFPPAPPVPLPEKEIELPDQPDQPDTSASSTDSSQPEPANLHDEAQDPTPPQFSSTIDPSEPDPSPLAPAADTLQGADVADTLQGADVAGGESVADAPSANAPDSTSGQEPPAQAHERMADGVASFVAELEGETTAQAEAEAASAALRAQEEAGAAARAQAQAEAAARAQAEAVEAVARAQAQAEAAARAQVEAEAAARAQAEAAEAAALVQAEAEAAALAQAEAEAAARARAEAEAAARVEMAAQVAAAATPAVAAETVEAAAPFQKLPSVGEAITVDKTGHPNHGLPGTVRFGPSEVTFSGGLWYGIELKVPAGKNNGTVKGVEYFVCEEKHGMFARLTNVKLGQPDGAEPAPEAAVVQAAPSSSAAVANGSTGSTNPFAALAPPVGPSTGMPGAPPAAEVDPANAARALASPTPSEDATASTLNLINQVCPL